MLRDKQSDRADEHLPNNKTPGKIGKKNPDWNPNPASNLLLKYYYYYYVVVVCVISLVTDRQVLSELLFRHKIKFFHPQVTGDITAKTGTHKGLWELCKGCFPPCFCPGNNCTKGMRSCSGVHWGRAAPPRAVIIHPTFCMYTQGTCLCSPV